MLGETMTPGFDTVVLELPVWFGGYGPFESLDRFYGS